MDPLICFQFVIETIPQSQSASVEMVWFLWILYDFHYVVIYY